ncbi:hypothetical protein [Streptomyces sp. NPDC048603]|uniref:hypothetical protein n=1 Tax=Streptomyces sp. NPDC048603 TaxID=3365577 RepID=UPI00371BA45A
MTGLHYNPADRTALFCAGCHRHRPRDEFRKTPWHGRAARCERCESWSSGEAWANRQVARQAWDLEQAREKLRAKSRYIRALQLRALIASAPSSADALEAALVPYYDALSRAVARQMGAAVPMRIVLGVEKHV